MSQAPNTDFIQIETKTGAYLIDIHVTPNAAQTKTEGLYGEAGQRALRVRLHAKPVDDQANEALVKWLAKELGLTQREIFLVRGQTARRKQFRIEAAAAARANWDRIIPPI
jgi:uncharacterized protein (TIGR00251 family)